MGIGTKNCEEHLYLREMFGRAPFIMSVPDDVDAIDDEFTASASAVGTNATLTTSPFYIGGSGVCIGFSDGAVTVGAGSSITFQITGTNQFGERVVESVVMAGVGPAQSLNAFRKITEIKMTAKSGVGAGGTVDIGWLLYSAGRRVGLPFKLKNATDIAALVTSSAAAPTLNPTLSAVYHTVLLPTSGIAATIAAPVHLMLADHAYLKY